MQLGNAIGSTLMQRDRQIFAKVHDVRKPMRTVKMDRADRHILRNFRHRRLDRADHLAAFAPMFFLLVEHPGGVENEQPELHIFDIAFGDHRLHGLLVTDRLAARRTADRTFGHHVNQVLDQSDGALGMMEPPAAQSRLRDLEPLTHRSQPGTVRHANAVEANPGMPARIGAVGPKADVPDDLKPFRFGRHDEHRRPTVRDRSRSSRS